MPLVTGGITGNIGLALFFFSRRLRICSRFTRGKWWREGKKKEEEGVLPSFRSYSRFLLNREGREYVSRFLRAYFGSYFFLFSEQLEFQQANAVEHVIILVDVTNILGLGCQIQEHF